MSDTTTVHFDLTPPSADELRQLATDLSNEERHVLLDHGTERPFCGVFLDEKRAGLFTCRLCGLPLFVAGAKFESGTGWPSFTRPIREPNGSANVVEKRDVSHLMIRTEVRSAHGDSHLGHVFNDGPGAEGGSRYCINSSALRFIHLDDLDEQGYSQYRSLFREGDRGKESA